MFMVSVAIYVDGQLKARGHFWPILESSECVCLAVSVQKRAPYLTAICLLSYKS